MLKASPPKPDEPKAAGKNDTIVTDMCILGGGPAGIALAASAASCGHKVVLVEKHRLGGTSLWYGTVPSKALAASAETAQAFRGAAQFGIGAFEPAVDWAQMAARTRELVAGLAPNASVERLTGLGVRVLTGPGRFIDPRILTAGETRIEARRYVIATGSTPALPDLKGLDDVAYLTTDTIFENRVPIDHLIVIGAGAAGCELSQSYRRLGARVTLIDQSVLLGRFDPELAAVVRAKLLAEGVVVHENARVEAVGGGAGRVRLEVLIGGARSRIEGSHLLIACGRRPTVSDIGLEAAKVAVTADGVKVDARLRTSNRRIFAMGDATGHPHNVQRAEYHARLLVSSLVLGRSAKVEPHLVPAAVYTDPELAVTGLSEAEARAAHGRVEVHRFPMRENVRALTERAPAGHIKVTTLRNGRILGVGIAARSAGELIQIWSLAISKGQTLADMAGWIAPHPTLGELNRKAAVHRYAAIAGHAAGRAWGRLLARLG
jgi:pyruvate/2-oxoglutarate dehydrogenase complex dihydrolipoamide dehydrogenase (E3) component